MAQSLNALIPMGINPSDWGNALAQGVKTGNALRGDDMDPYQKATLALKLREVKSLEAGGGMTPAQKANLDLAERRTRVAEEAAARGPAAPSSYQEYDRAKSEPAYAAYLSERKPATDTQAKTATFVDRLGQAHKIITDQEKVLEKHPWQAGANYVLGEELANPMLGADMQQSLQAQRNFINSVLRRESGAVISPSEFDSARIQYFPQIGDEPEKIALKRQNRLTVINGMSREAGPQYQAPELYDPQAAAPPQGQPGATPSPGARPVPTMNVSPDGSMQPTQPPVTTDMPVPPPPGGLPNKERSIELLRVADEEVKAGILTMDQVKSELVKRGITEEYLKSLGISEETFR